MGIKVSDLIAQEEKIRATLSPTELAAYDQANHAELKQAIAGLSKVIPRIPVPKIPSFIKEYATISEQINQLVGKINVTPYTAHIAKPAMLEAIHSAERAHKLLAGVKQANEILQAYTSIFKIDDILENLRISFKQAQVRLWDEGWMIHPSMPLLGLKELLYEANASSQQIDEVLHDYYSSKVDEMEEQLVTLYPVRNQALHDAFSAHRKGLYFASIPLLLSLADGIFGDIVGTSQGLFGRKRGDHKRNALDSIKAKASQDNLGQPKVSIFLSILDEIGPINACKAERDQYQDPFNRHLVMHGHDTSYGTETNSLKAMSLVHFVGSFLADYRVETNSL